MRHDLDRIEATVVRQNLPDLQHAITRTVQQHPLAAFGQAGDQRFIVGNSRVDDEELACGHKVFRGC